ncbi:MAG: hypothetical protein LAT82_03065 [Nanoarchaeota archaeon]|nr:hypothetical protein [Nanoarchaeota archaeon]
MKIKNKGKSPIKNITGISNMKNRIERRIDKTNSTKLMIIIVEEEENFILIFA